MDNAFISQWCNWDHRMPLAWHKPVNRLLALLKINARLVARPFRWGMANVEARMNIFHLASQCLANRVPGAVLEIGCNAGESSVVLQHVINTLDPGRPFHCFDSFEGLPAPQGIDAEHGPYDSGDMSASLVSFYDQFRRAGLKPPEHVHKGWFEDTIPSQLPDRISFVLLDGDLYASTKHVLPHIYERMAPGAICMFGVYYDHDVFPRPETIPHYKSPGVKLATDEFFADKPEKVSVLYACEYSNGYFRKQ